MIDLLRFARLNHPSPFFLERGRGVRSLCFKFKSYLPETAIFPLLIDLITSSYSREMTSLLYCVLIRTMKMAFTHHTEWKYHLRYIGRTTSSRPTNFSLPSFWVYLQRKVIKFVSLVSDAVMKVLKFSFPAPQKKIQGTEKNHLKIKFDFLWN